jgi:hypothetical protein
MWVQADMDVLKGASLAVRIMGTFPIIKVGPGVFHLSGEIMRNVPIIPRQLHNGSSRRHSLIHAFFRNRTEIHFESDTDAEI